jgi:hypothetical protein
MVGLAEAEHQRAREAAHRSGVIHQGKVARAAEALRLARVALADHLQAKVA